MTLRVTDALSFVRRWTATWWGAALFGLVFLFPVLGNVISRLTKKHGWWLNDYDALICGAQSLAHGQSPYSLHPVCEGIRPAPFVYAPQVAAFFAPFVNATGLMGARWLYLIVLVPATLLLIWYALFKLMPKTPFVLRLMTFAAINGSAFACGNIGIPLHALVLAGALALPRTRLPFIAAVILGALVKPVFLTYLIVLLYQDKPLIDRVRATVISAVVGLAAVAWLLYGAGPLSAQWHGILGAIVVQQQPGIGFFSYTSLIGLPGQSTGAQLAFVVFAGVMALSGLVLAEWSGLEPSERIVLGLGIAQLLNPRLMDYDLMMLAPAIVLIVMLAKPLGARTFAWVSWAFFAVLVLAVVLNIAEVNAIKRAPIAVFVYCGITIFVAARTAQQHEARIRGWVKDPKTLFAKAA